MLRFKLFGMEVRIDFLFVALITVFLLTDSTGIAIVGLSACVLHELAHVAAFYAVGFTPSLLAFEATGVRLQKPSRLLPRIREFIVLIAGSGINLLVFLLLWFSFSLGDSTVSSPQTAAALAVSHLSVGVYNLLPLKGLDGGKLLAMLFSLFLPQTAVYRCCNMVDLAVLAMLISGGIFIFIKTGGSFTLTVFLCTLIFTAVKRIIGG